MKNSTESVANAVWMKDHLLKIQVSARGVDESRDYVCAGGGCHKVFRPSADGSYSFNALVYRKGNHVYDVFCDDCVEEMRKSYKAWRKYPILTMDQVPKKERQLVRRALVDVNYNIE